ncbi:hypothetical protein ACJ41O_006087 [Fusarium nematophilum]
MASKVCTTCNKEFSKAEHLKRHERSRRDVLFRHCKKHDQDAQRERRASLSREKNGEAEPMQGVTATSQEEHGSSSITVAYDIMPYSPPSPSPSSSETYGLLLATPVVTVPEPMVDVLAVSLDAPQGDVRPPPQDTYQRTMAPTLDQPPSVERSPPDMDRISVGELLNMMPNLTPPCSDSPPGPRLIGMHDHLAVGSLDAVFPSESFDTMSFAGPERPGVPEAAVHFALDDGWWFPEPDPAPPRRVEHRRESDPTGQRLATTTANGLSATAGGGTFFTFHNQQRSNSCLASRMSEEQLSLLQRVWVRGSGRKTRAMLAMWQALTAGDGLFGALAEASPVHSPDQGAVDYALRAEAKERVWVAFRELMRSTDHSIGPAINADLLELAYEQYIQYHHSVVPLFHLASFSPLRAPASLLVVMCTIGLSVIDRDDLNQMVSNIFPALLKMTSDELHASSTANALLTSRLEAMSTALLVLTLASIIGHKSQIPQTESLYVTLLSNAQSEGLFSANELSISPARLASIPTEDKRWRVWGSIESVKRLVTQLIQLDSWYASHLGVDLVLRPEGLHILPTCDEELFQASTLDKWSRMRPDYSQMDHPVITAVFTSVPPPVRGFDVASTTLMLLQLRLTAETTLLQGSPPQNLAPRVPWTLLTRDARGNDLLNLIIGLAEIADEQDRSFDLNCAIAWHALCMTLGADLALLETAAGRSGPAAAAHAMKEISSWATTPWARRSAFHAARIFKLVFSRRYCDPVKLHSIVALFQAALVFGFYLCTMPDHDSGDILGIYDDVDWVALGSTGLCDSTSETSHSPATASHGLAQFILDGGRLSVPSFTLQTGYAQARKSWLHFASLMQGLGRWKTRTFARILYVLCDNLSEMEQNATQET